MASPASKVHSSSHVFRLLPYHPPGLPDSRTSFPYPVADTAGDSIKRMINSNLTARSFLIALPSYTTKIPAFSDVSIREKAGLCLPTALMGALH
jgi:hypothetical protein